MMCCGGHGEALLLLLPKEAEERRLRPAFLHAIELALERAKEAWRRLLKKGADFYDRRHART